MTIPASQVPTVITTAADAMTAVPAIRPCRESRPGRSSQPLAAITANTIPADHPLEQAQADAVLACSVT